MINKKIVFFYLLMIWIFIGFFNVFYNSLKSYSEAKQWLFLTNEQKLYVLYGNVVNVYTLINKSSDVNAKTLLYTNDNMLFFLIRYYIYPKKIIWVTNEKNYQKQIATKTFTFLIDCEQKMGKSGYKKIANFNSQQSGSVCSLYQRIWIH